MIEAALFYQAAATGLGADFLDDVQRAIDSVREHPELGAAAGYGLRRTLVRRFPSALSMQSSRGKSSSSPLPTSGVLPTIGSPESDEC